eukprot:symbB.v1.2.016338.t1/scaffold1222.1/size194531/12
MLVGGLTTMLVFKEVPHVPATCVGTALAGYAVTALEIPLDKLDGRSPGCGTQSQLLTEEDAKKFCFCFLGLFFAWLLAAM